MSICLLHKFGTIQFVLIRLKVCSLFVVCLLYLIASQGHMLMQFIWKSYDLNDTDCFRNTTPYSLTEEDAFYDFLYQPNKRNYIYYQSFTE